MNQKISCQDALSDMGKTKIGELHYKLSLVLVYGALTEKLLLWLRMQILMGILASALVCIPLGWLLLFRGYSPLLGIGDNSSVGIAQVGIALGWVYWKILRPEFMKI